MIGRLDCHLKFNVNDMILIFFFFGAWPDVDGRCQMGIMESVSFITPTTAYRHCQRTLTAYIPRRLSLAEEYSSAFDVPGFIVRWVLISAKVKGNLGISVE